MPAFSKPEIDRLPPTHPMPIVIDAPWWVEPHRNRAEVIFRAGVHAADPQMAVKRALSTNSEKREACVGLEGQPDAILSHSWKAINVVAIGKAACAMAKAALQVIPSDLFGAHKIIVTNRENLEDMPGFQVIAAGHPLPDAGGLAGARAIKDCVESSGADELILVLISGGGSALLPCPPDGLSLKDKIETTELLLGCGADIGQVNTVRKHLSLLKGGGLARLAAPSVVHALVLSDVLGDDLSAIASGPTVPDPTSHSEAVQILKSHKVWDRIPQPVQSYLIEGCRGAVAETPKPGDPVFSKVSNRLIGSNGVSLAAVERAAKHGSRQVRVHKSPLVGEAREEARKLAHIASDAIAAADGPFAYVCGGETTVTLRGEGLGGRNQEMALAFAIAAEQLDLPRRWVFLSGGTDGRDGPTDAAGGLVDPWSLDRMRSAGCDPREFLNRNDSYRALESSGDLLRTGSTGTNVADLQILLIN